MDDTARQDAQYLMTNEKFNSLLQEQVASLRDEYNHKSYDSVDPDLLLFGSRESDDEYSLTVVTIRTPEFNDQRYKLMEELGRTSRIKKLQPIATFLISEAWVRSFTPEELIERQGREIAAYADKKEAAFIAGMTIDGRTNLAISSIKRVGKTIRLLESQKYLYDPAKADDKNPHSDLLKYFYLGYMSQLQIELRSKSN